LVSIDAADTNAASTVLPHTYRGTSERDDGTKGLTGEDDAAAFTHRPSGARGTTLTGRGSNDVATRTAHRQGMQPATPGPEFPVLR